LLLDAGGDQVRTEQLDALGHGAGRDQNLGDEDFVVLKLLADDVHAIEQALLQDVLRRDALVQGLLYTSLYLGRAALLQPGTNVSQNGAHSDVSPFTILSFGFPAG